MEVVSYHNWSDFVYIDSWWFVVWDFKKTNWRYCIAELTFIFGECNKAGDNVLPFPRVPAPDTYVGEKNNDMVYLCTGFTMLPLHRNNGMEPKRRLAYPTEIADFYRMQMVAKKNLSRGQNGRVSGNKTFLFFVFVFGPIGMH